MTGPGSIGPADPINSNFVGHTDAAQRFAAGNITKKDAATPPLSTDDEALISRDFASAQAEKELHLIERSFVSENIQAEQAEETGAQQSAALGKEVAGIKDPKKTPGKKATVPLGDGDEPGLYDADDAARGEEGSLVRVKMVGPSAQDETAQVIASTYLFGVHGDVYADIVNPNNAGIIAAGKEKGLEAFSLVRDMEMGVATSIEPHANIVDFAHRPDDGPYFMHETGYAAMADVVGR